LYQETGKIGQLCWLMLHLIENSTGRTEFCHGKAMVSGKQGSIYLVGQLTNTQYRTPSQWASHLGNIVSDFAVSKHCFVFMFVFIG